MVSRAQCITDPPPAAIPLAVDKSRKSPGRSPSSGGGVGSGIGRTRPAPRSDAERRILRAFRVLTGSRAGGARLPRTVVACSGGADSVALALALVRGKVPVVLAHVVHDLRPASAAHADRDRVRELGRRLGVPVIEGAAAVRRVGRGNHEAIARRLRYAELARIAREHDAPFIATGHHADDQLETVLMALVRGAGVRGLGGIAAKRGLAGTPRVMVIRPMLHPLAAITRAESEAICRAAGEPWAIDATNADTTRLRAALRHGVIPALRALRPSAPAAAARAAALHRSAAEAIERRARTVLGPEASVVVRSRLAREPEVVIGAVVRREYRDVIGAAGIDRVSARAISGVVDAVRDLHSEARTFDLGRLRVTVRGGVVRGDRLVGGEVGFSARTRGERRA